MIETMEQARGAIARVRSQVPTLFVLLMAEGTEAALNGPRNNGYAVYLFRAAAREATVER